MSIATELQNYNDGLISAYNAVSSKGGTVPANKNLSNLPTAINSISGGTAKEATDWGRIYFYKFGIGLYVGFNGNCEVSNVDVQMLIDYLNNNYSWGITTGKDLLYLNVRGELQTDTWFVQCDYNNSETGVYLSTNWNGDETSLESDLGISVTVEDPGLGYTGFEVRWDYVIDTTSSINSLELSENEFTNIGDNLLQKNGIIAMGTLVPRVAVYGFDFGSEATVTPQNCLAQCVSLEEVDFSFATRLTRIEAGFMKSCSDFNSTFIIPNTVTAIEGKFMQECWMYAQNLTIPSGCSVNGYYFMYGCGRVSEITVNGTINNAGNYTLSTAFINNPMYNPGITVYGSNRASWISSLPNRTSNPYRKLIDGAA